MKPPRDRQRVDQFQLNPTPSQVRSNVENSRPAKSFTVATRPRLAAHVISALFPITGLVVFEKADASDPLRRFPGVELRNDQPHWAAMFRRNRRAIVHESE